MENSVGAIIIDIEGLSLSSEDIELLQHPNVGGVILFARNYESPEQLLALTQHIKSIRSNCLICVDQEGGRVQRFSNGLSKLPSMNQLGQLIDSSKSNIKQVGQIALQLGQLMAMELRSLGVDLSFAPVLDLATDLNAVVQQRAIHRDPQIISELANAYIQGMKQAGMAACGKHFPGHGHVKVDSHLSLPIDERTFDELVEDLMPFQYLIQNNIQALMPGHLLFSKIDKKPATFSSYWLQTVLREKMGFLGTIVSDDLNMEAAREIGDMSECAEQSLLAGCDYVLVCNNRPEAINVLSHVTVSFDKETLIRRQALFPEHNIPTWDELSESVVWQQAQTALKYFHTTV
tara:strand:- start:9932 stop:10972 length:1041 start_codon:yes stop_codon:yes gene_type:complete